MDDKDLNLETNNDNVYRAMPNLNTAIEDPSVNMDGVMDVNIQDLDVNNNQSLNINNNIDVTHGYTNSIPNNIPNVDNKDNVYLYNNLNDSNDNLNLNNQQNGVQESIENGQNTPFISTNNVEASSVNNVQNNNINNYMQKDVVLNNKNINDIYKPTFKSKKKPGSGLVIPKELTALIVLVVVLLLFLFVIPYVYDFFRDLDLVVTSG